jgi:aminopeptidase
MIDPRVTKLAQNLVSYSTSLKAGEKLLIEVSSTKNELVSELIKAASKVGALPFVSINSSTYNREIVSSCSAEYLKYLANYAMVRMTEMDAYIGIRDNDNASEMSDVPTDKMNLYSKLYSHPVHHEIRVNNTKWCVMRYPTPSMAQLAGMSTEAFEDLYFDVCNLDYSNMFVAMDALVEVMNHTDKVHIIGPGTDLSFSIKDIPAIKCAGEMNIPDGEVYTAPVRDSVNGSLSYNVPSTNGGFTFENVQFEFENGKIVKATSNDIEKINSILDKDDGARYIGEFSLGLNPFIIKPMNDILFDEKICGSFHFTPGSCYKDANNGNDSSEHWDLVCVQTPEYGGGEIWFDDVLIRKDGLFVLDSLLCLNPEKLK